MGLLKLCEEKPPTVGIEATAAEAIQVMLDNSVGGVAVIDAEHRVAGIFTERDVLRKLALSGLDPHKIPVRELMTTPVDMATTETTPGEAFEEMVSRHYRHLPIVDKDGRLLGLLSIRHLLQWRLEELGQQLDSMEQYVTNDAPGG
ncbi:MAG: CBS domain-containing protein [Terriglobales bacterium]